MSQPTPESRCGCYVHIDTDPLKTKIKHCPLHALAQEMRDFIESLATVQYRADGLIYFDPTDVAEQARALLAGEKIRTLIYATLETDVATTVILNGVTVYHEDDDKGQRHIGLSARDVADRLSKALDLPLHEVALTFSDVDVDTWNFDDLETAALMKMSQSS